MKSHLASRRQLIGAVVECLDDRILLSFDVSLMKGATWQYEVTRGNEHGSLTEMTYVNRPDYTVYSDFSFPSGDSSSQITTSAQPGHDPADTSIAFDIGAETITLTPDTPITRIPLSKVGDQQSIKPRGIATLRFSDGQQVKGAFKESVTQTLLGFEDVELAGGTTIQGAKHLQEQFTRAISFSYNDHKVTLTSEDSLNSYSSGLIGVVSSTTDQNETEVVDGKKTSTKTTLKLRLLSSSFLFDAVMFNTPGQLSITGSAQADRMKIYRDGDQLVVSDNGASQRFKTADVTSIAIDGRGGNDAIEIEPGVVAASINGGEGNDLIQGGDGNDTIDGGLGNNTLLGGPGDDRINGDAGNDKLYGQSGRDTLNGNGGNDILDGGGGVDHLFGGDGNDSLLGGGGNDQVYGQAGKDTLNGQAGDDLLDGGEQPDVALTDDNDHLVSIQHPQHAPGSPLHTVGPST